MTELRCESFSRQEGPEKPVETLGSVFTVAGARRLLRGRKGLELTDPQRELGPNTGKRRAMGGLGEGGGSVGGGVGGRELGREAAGGQAVWGRRDSRMVPGCLLGAPGRKVMVPRQAAGLSRDRVSERGLGSLRLTLG